MSKVNSDELALQFKDDGAVVLTQSGHQGRENRIELTRKHRECAAELMRSQSSGNDALAEVSLGPTGHAGVNEPVLRFFSSGEVRLTQIDQSRAEVNVISDWVTNMSDWASDDSMLRDVR